MDYKAGDCFSFLKHCHPGRGTAARSTSSASRRAGERSTRQADCRLLASSLTPGLASSTFVEIKPSMAGQPERIYQLAEAGRGWPRLEAALSLIWRL